MKGIRLKDFPSFIRTTDPNDFFFKFILSEIEKAKKASAIIFNSFDELEHDVIDALSSILPPIYSVGPLPILQNHIQDNDLKLLGLNLWKEESECLQWLDSKEHKSVVYVNFGSVTVMTPNQMIEFAWGLANSNQNFLWIIRSDLVIGDLAVLPPEFVEEIKDRGLLAGWCPQEKVLGHPAIGGFLTHCGWNSTLESISAGVPMICWPFFADQQTNCWFCCTQWGIGMEIENDATRNKIESLVRELMNGERGKEVKNKALDWKQKAEEAGTGSAEIEKAKKASAIILNSFDELEHDVIDALSSILPPIYSVGPLPILQNHIQDNDLKLLGLNLWKEESECLQWLDSKEHKSVVYVNFGSVTVMTPNQMIEFAWGLANSNQNFLWIIRSDLVIGDLAVLPPEFVEEIKDRGLLAGWCPQEKVLGHPAIGGFLTHCGWNSTLESISAGVPMICWPFFADQQTNCWFCCTQWGIGMEIENDATRNKIESLVRELMNGERGKEVKNKALDWKQKAEEAGTGSAYVILEKMINQVLLTQKY
ncbi:unnamed protein product [Ilex paraguariensis]|uniref:Glycosyltransferase n=1 Tax=Ilex paraguariensis TaxID=185542 RepID=A0ABC8TV76_9AQUA